MSSDTANPLASSNSDYSYSKGVNFSRSRLVLGRVQWKISHGPLPQLVSVEWDSKTPPKAPDYKVGDLANIQKWRFYMSVYGPGKVKDPLEYI